MYEMGANSLTVTDFNFVLEIHTRQAHQPFFKTLYVNRTLHKVR